MRAALITIAEQPRDRKDAALVVAGKTLAERQLGFALAAGCERIIALGHGAAAEAIALRHLTERAGAIFQVIGNSHGLLGAVRATDELLVLAPGLLADEHAALPALQKSNVVLILPAAPAVAAGFERIDLERAWAGAAVIPGSLVERLSELPSDAEPTSALLRIAMQARTPEVQLSEQGVADGIWQIVGDDCDVEAIGQAWLARRLRSNANEGLSPWFAGEILGLVANRLLERKRSFAALVVGAAVLLVGSFAASWFTYSSIGFALVTLGSLTAALALGLLPLSDEPRRTLGRATRQSALPLLPFSIDLTLYLCVILAIDGAWLHRLFPPTALFLALYLRAPAAMPGFLRWGEDRALLSALFGFAAAFGLAEPAVMGAAMVILLMKAVRWGKLNS